MTKVTMHELRQKKVMTDEQIAVFNDLLNNADFKGKKALRNLLWLNTTAPKFAVGDVVIIRENGSRRIWDMPVRRAVGAVKQISASRLEEVYNYAVECTFEKDGKQYMTTLHGGETDLEPAGELKINTAWS